MESVMKYLGLVPKAVALEEAKEELPLMVEPPPMVVLMVDSMK